MTLADKKEIKERVDTAWRLVFKASSKVLRDANIYGFSLMEDAPDPNIHQMLVSLRVLDVFLSEVAEYGEYTDHDGMRLLLNAREQVRRMQNVAVAIKGEDQEAYEAAIAELEKQATF